jgi:predicted TIM-barrel fold metal-dependent hydrolase
MSRYTVISADCHAGPSFAEGGYLDWVDPAYREQLRDDMAAWSVMFKERMAKLFAPEFTAGQDNTDAARQGGRSGAWDPHRRLKELEADGIVADVIFPDGTQDNGPPFQAAEGPGGIGANWEFQAIGAWAHNRWLADFCATNPGRHAGVALMTVHDVDEAVRQVQWAAEHGLRGVLLPAGVGTLPFYNHDRYEPIWAVCEDVGLPLHTHVGSAVPDYQDLPGSNAIFAMESPWFSHRPLAFLIWGGVFERHPRLTVVFAEQGADWVPDLFRMMDNMYDYMFSHEKDRLSVRPSEYWARQCYVEAMFLRKREADMRHQIGVANMVWGSDYPHYEGSWPNSEKMIRDALGDAPPDEIRAILSENAAKVYGFDLPALDTVGARIGPDL